MGLIGWTWITHVILDYSGGLMSACQPRLYHTRNWFPACERHPVRSDRLQPELQRSLSVALPALQGIEQLDVPLDLHQGLLWSWRGSLRSPCSSKRGVGGIENSLWSLVLLREPEEHLEPIVEVGAHRLGQRGWRAS